MAAKHNNNAQRIEVSLWGTSIGILSWNQRMQVSTFWFSPEYFGEPYDLAPITHPKGMQSSAIGITGLREPKIYQGLPPFLSDSLPDKWGNDLFDQWFADEGLHEKDKTPLTKLSFIGRDAKYVETAKNRSTKRYWMQASMQCLMTKKRSWPERTSCTKGND